MNRFNLCILALCALAAIALGLLIAKRLRPLTAASRSVKGQEVIVLLGILLIGSIAIYGSFLLGRSAFAYLDAGSDTYEVYVPFYTNLIEGIRSGSLGAWNFEYGLGAAATSYQSWLLDPFNVALIPLGLLLGSGRLSLALALVQILKIVVSGLAFDLLLKRYCETPFGRIVGASFFAFGGFLLLWGQHYWLGSVYAVFAVGILQFERLMELWSAPRFCCVALVSAVSVGWSAYCGFMSLLGAALYCLLRLVHAADGEHGTRRVVMGTLRLCLPVLCGVLLAGVALVPYASYLLGETSRVASGAQSSLTERAGSFLLGFVPLRWVPMVLSRFLGSGLISSGAAIPAELVPPTESFPYVNCYELIVLGFGPLALVLLLQFFHWVARDCSRKDRALVVIASVLIALYCFNEFLPALFNVFVEPKYRSSFVLAVPVCIALAMGWEKRVQAGRASRAAVLAGVIPTVAILIWSAVNSVNGKWLCLACLVITAAFCAIALFSSSQGKPCHTLARHSVSCVVLAGLAVAGCVLDGFYVTQVRATCASDDFPSREAEAAQDTLDALAWIRQSDDGLYRIEKTYVDSCSYNDALVQGYWGVNTYNSTTDGDVVEFYRTLWPDAYNGDSAVQDFRADVDGYSLLSQLGVRYLLSKDPIADSRFTLVKQVGSVYIYHNEGATPLLFTRETIMSEGDLQALPTDTARHIAALNAIIVSDDLATPSGEQRPADLSSRLELDGRDRIIGTVESSAATVSCLSLPYSSGWSVRIDGEEVETFRANLGFIGFEVPEGTHALEVSFSLPGLRQGAMLSVAGIALTAASCVVGARVAAGRARRESLD